MKIYKKDNDIFEYELDNKVYCYSKDQVDVENEHQDEGLVNYLIILKHTSNSQERLYKKTFPTRTERDANFTGLKEEHVDFLKWEEYQTKH